MQLKDKFVCDRLKKDREDCLEGEPRVYIGFVAEFQACKVKYRRGIT